MASAGCDPAGYVHPLAGEVMRGAMNVRFHFRPFGSEFAPAWFWEWGNPYFV